MSDPRNPVRDVMSRGVVSVDENLTVRSLAAVLAELSTSALPWYGIPTAP